MNVLHVPTIMNNLVSVGQIVDQGMEARFTHLGCFIEEEGRVIVQGRRDGRMFILDSTNGGIAMFVKGQKAESDINLWQADRPCQLPAASRAAIETGGVRIAQI